MDYKILLKTSMTNKHDPTDQRGPSLETIQKYLDEYSVGFNGIIVCHDTMYDYQYEIQHVRYYRSVDTTGIIGYIKSTVIEDNQLFLIVTLDEEKFDDTKDYICTYRAMMQTNPDNDLELLMINLFSVDLITIQPNEKTKDMVLSTITRLEGEDEKGELEQND